MADLTLKDFSIGESVTFGRSHGEKTRGTVVGKGTKKLKIRQDESRGTMKSHKVGTIWTVPVRFCQKIGTGAPVGTPLSTPPPVVRRPDAEIIADIRSIYAGLSPENLTCDGERSQSESRRWAAHYRQGLRRLFAEIGREVTESEACGDKTVPVSRNHYSPARASGHSKGDKVVFTTKSGQEVIGFICRINTKTISVQPLDGGNYWRVSPSLLRKAA